MFDDVTVQKFWRNVSVCGPDECWEWKGSKSVGGYGVIGKRRATHVALFIDGKPRVDSLKALHSCDNPPCCNPNHLRWGTDKDNADDMVGRRRHHANSRDFCLKGHPFSGDNLIARKNGQRGCRICQRAMNAAYKARKRSKKNV